MEALKVFFMDKRLTQIADQVMLIPITPKSMTQIERLIDSYLMNFNFETMTHADHLEFIRRLGLILERFRLIRGR